MPLNPRRAAAAAIAVLALAAGAAPTLATASTSRVASPQTQLDKTIHQDNPLIYERLSLNPNGFAGDSLLTANVKNCIQYAKVVARVRTTSPAQSEARAYWTTGALLRAAGDGELIQGINEEDTALTRLSTSRTERGSPT